MDSHLPNELGVITLASPCSVPWESLEGDARVRHCGQCGLNVYNVEAMTSFEVRNLMVEREGKACLRLYRRADGTLITKDCPVGLALVGRAFRSEKQRARLHFKNRWVVNAAAALAVAWLGVHFAGDQLRRALAELDPDAPQYKKPDLSMKTMGGCCTQVNQYGSSWER